MRGAPTPSVSLSTPDAPASTRKFATASASSAASSTRIVIQAGDAGTTTVSGFAARLSTRLAIMDLTYHGHKGTLLVRDRRARARAARHRYLRGPRSEPTT